MRYRYYQINILVCLFTLLPVFFDLFKRGCLLTLVFCVLPFLTLGSIFDKRFCSLVCFLFCCSCSFISLFCSLACFLFCCSCSFACLFCSFACFFICIACSLSNRSCFFSALRFASFAFLCCLASRLASRSAFNSCLNCLGVLIPVFRLAFLSLSFCNNDFRVYLAVGFALSTGVANIFSITIFSFMLSFRPAVLYRKFPALICRSVFTAVMLLVNFCNPLF